MIKRYTREEMGAVWSEQNKFESMKTVEVSVAQVQAVLGIIPKSAAKNIASKAKFKISEIEKIEKVTKNGKLKSIKKHYAPGAPMVCMPSPPPLALSSVVF